MFSPRARHSGMTPAAFPPWARAEALGVSMPEFALFQDEPPQMRSGTAGKTGFPPFGFRAPLWQNDPGKLGTSLSLHGAARLALRRTNARLSLRVLNHHYGLLAAGRPTCARHYPSSARTSAHHLPIGNQRFMRWTPIMRRKAKLLRLPMTRTWSFCPIR